MIPLGVLNRPPDTVTQLYKCTPCKRISGEQKCSICGGPTEHVGQAGMWKPQPQIDVVAKMEAMQKEIEELKNKK